MDTLFYGMGVARAHMKAAIADASATVARDSARSTQRELRSVETELDRLELLLEAQWSLLREKLGLTDEDLKRRVREIDLQDGKLDGRVTRSPTTTCRACDRATSSRNVRCIYCGEPL